MNEGAVGKDIIHPLNLLFRMWSEKNKPLYVL